MRVRSYISHQFNDIVQKNNMQLPTLEELTQTQKTHKTTLEWYLKHLPEHQLAQKEKEFALANKDSHKQKKAHFKIDDGEGTQEHEAEEGEEFNDSDEEHQHKEEGAIEELKAGDTE